MVHPKLDLSDQTYRDVERIARENKRTPDQVLREFIDKAVAEWHRSKSKSATGGLSDLANLGITGLPRDLSTKLDDYLYGDK